MKEIGVDFLEKNSKEFIEIARELYNNPEVSNKEFFAVEYLTTFLKKYNFEIKKNIAGYKTGFIAKKCSNKGKGKTIAFLAEYDALPNLGHGCGHNLIAAISIAAAVSLSKELKNLQGSIYVIGCPAEEGGEKGSSKAKYAKSDIFSNVDVAFIIHPGNEDSPTPKTLSVTPVDFEFFGVASHAAAAPEKGKNALEALINFFGNISILTKSLPKSSKINGIIVNGGLAPNIIPDYTKARFYIRAENDRECKELTKKVKKIAENACILTGCTYKIRYFQNHVSNLIPTPYLEELYKKSFDGELKETKDYVSTDVGNVSHVIPVLHPILKVTDEYKALHTKEFLKAVDTSLAHNKIIDGAKTLVKLGKFLFENPKEFDKIKKSHKEELKNE